jgi:hypothetical protein
MFKRLLVVILTLILVGCSSTAAQSNEYPTAGTPSPSQTQENVLWPNTPLVNVLSDGSLAQIDYSCVNDGYVCAKLLQDISGIKIQISKDDKKYNYDLTSTEFVSFPMNMGNGTYTLKILQQIEGDRYAICATQDIEVSLTDENSPYLYPNQIVQYNQSSLVYSKSFELVDGDEDDLTRVAHLFQYVVDTLDYDDDKAKNVSDSFHLPDIEGSLTSGKGICFDYAASLAALCRIQGIPAKVIVGWTDIEYHAWVEIYIKDKGWINPKIYFKKKKWNLVDPTFSDSENSDYEGKYEEVYHY